MSIGAARWSRATVPMDGWVSYLVDGYYIADCSALWWEKYVSCGD